MSDKLTHFIPVHVFSNNMIDFLSLRYKFTEGKQMINESVTVIPQFIPPYMKMEDKSAIQQLADLKNKVPQFTKQQLQIYFTYYGEYRCTEEQFNEWLEKQKDPATMKKPGEKN